LAGVLQGGTFWITATRNVGYAAESGSELSCGGEAGTNAMAETVTVEVRKEMAKVALEMAERRAAARRARLTIGYRA
jgi:hypothetical protein